MPKTTLLHDCSQLIAATEEAGGQAPEVLTNILAGAQLLNTPRTASDPAREIVDSAARGQLTEAKLTELIEVTAHKQVTINCAGELRSRSERLFVERFHKELAAGACDELLSTLRPTWDKHAEAVAEARSEISSESSAEHILMSGSPKLVQCWQQLPGHLAKLNQIAAVARQFGPRLGNFPLIKEAGNSDNHLLEDSAIWCADGGLEADSAAFRRPGVQPRQHALFNVPLKLHSLESARERYRRWAAAQWEQRHSGPMSSWIDEEGRAHQLPRPVNPYADAAQ